MNSQELLKQYAIEMVNNLNQQDLLKLRAKEILDSVKESELMKPAEFNLLVKAVRQQEELQEDADRKLAAIVRAGVLGLI